MAPPRIRKVFSGFAPDLQIYLKGPCSCDNVRKKHYSKLRSTLLIKERRSLFLIIQIVGLFFNPEGKNKTRVHPRVLRPRVFLLHHLRQNPHHRNPHHQDPHKHHRLLDWPK